MAHQCIVVGKQLQPILSVALISLSTSIRFRFVLFPHIRQTDALISQGNRTHDAHSIPERPEHGQNLYYKDIGLFRERSHWIVIPIASLVKSTRPISDTDLIEMESNWIWTQDLGVLRWQSAAKLGRDYFSSFQMPRWHDVG